MRRGGHKGGWKTESMHIYGCAAHASMHIQSVPELSLHFHPVVLEEFSVLNKNVKFFDGEIFKRDRNAKLLNNEIFKMC